MLGSNQSISQLIATVVCMQVYYVPGTIGNGSVVCVSMKSGTPIMAALITAIPQKQTTRDAKYIFSI